VSEWVPSDSAWLEYRTLLGVLRDEENIPSTVTSNVQFAVPWSSIPVPLLAVTTSESQRGIYTIVGRTIKRKGNIGTWQRGDVCRYANSWISSDRIISSL
jgi:hypothetical protein